MTFLLCILDWGRDTGKLGCFFTPRAAFLRKEDEIEEFDHAQPHTRNDTSFDCDRGARFCGFRCNGDRHGGSQWA